MTATDTWPLVELVALPCSSLVGGEQHPANILLFGSLQMYNGHLLRPFVPLEERNGDVDPAELAKAPTGRRVLNRHVSCRTHRHM